MKLNMRRVIERGREIESDKVYQLRGREMQIELIENLWMNNKKNKPRLLN